ncbi:MAG: hypothetical protein LBJ83_00110 [Oscillospiraceae bacterium]|jgi:hypothetical protein|nr:hypothetical protein [Oscillospiraceae bacterium]
MSILKLRDEYRLAAEKLHLRVVELTQRYKMVCRKEKLDIKRRIICLYTEIRELLNVAKNIDCYCKRNMVLGG